MATAMTLYWYQLDSGVLAPTYYGQLDATVRELCTENAVTPPTAPWQSQLACSLVSTWLTQIDRAVRAVAAIAGVSAPAVTLPNLNAGQFEATYWHQLDSCVREIINPTENTVAPAVTPSAPVAGDLLTTTNGTWTGGSGTPAYTYQWWVDGVAVSGATAQTYQTVEAQDGLDVYCVVTNTNATGVVSAQSNTVTLEFVGPLDLVPGAVGAFSSARALSAAMVGQALYTVQKLDGGAEPTQSFSSNGSGEAPSASIASFLGADDGAITLWNDQSGAGKDITAAISQDIIWTASVQGGKPGFVSAAEAQLDTFESEDTFSFPNGGATIFLVASLNAAVDKYNGDPNVALSSSNPPYCDMYDGGDNRAGGELAAQPDAGVYLWEAAWQFGSTSFLINGANQTIDNSLDSGGALVPFSESLKVYFAQAGVKILEVLVYASVLSAGNRTTLRQNIAAYYGVTLS